MKPSLKAKIPKKTKDLPATHGMLLEVRDELLAKLAEHDEIFRGIDARFDKIDARFEEIDARFEEIDARFEQIDARFDQVDARFLALEAKMDAGFAEIRSLFHQSLLRFEEQRSENRIVLEALQALTQRQDRVESETTQMRHFVSALAQAKAPPITP